MILITIGLKAYMNEITDNLGTEFVDLGDGKSGWLNGATNFISAIRFDNDIHMQKHEEKISNLIENLAVTCRSFNANHFDLYQWIFKD